MIKYAHQIVKHNEKYRINKKLYSRKIKHKGYMMDDTNDKMVISKTEYDKLKEESALLYALRASGVDNWEGYSNALKLVYGEEKEDDIDD